METKKGETVSIMRERIIAESIKNLQNEGLKFSVDTLAEKLKISKKTIYKYFPTKEALALAMYEKYYSCSINRAKDMLAKEETDVHPALLHLYYDSKKMIRREIFNKYTLNEIISSYALGQNDILWSLISSTFKNPFFTNDKETARTIVDGTFEKLCNTQQSPDTVIERLVCILW